MPRDYPAPKGRAHPDAAEVWRKDTAPHHVGASPGSETGVSPQMTMNTAGSLPDSASVKETGG